MIRVRHQRLRSALWKGSENSEPTYEEACAAHDDRGYLLDALTSHAETIRRLEEELEAAKTVGVMALEANRTHGETIRRLESRIRELEDGKA